MSEVVKFLDTEDVQYITAAIRNRQRNFPNEDFTMTVGVVLLNYGDRLVEVQCIGGEWNGVKGALQPGPGLPVCPNGHPLLELTEAPRLALAKEA